MFSHLREPGPPCPSARPAGQVENGRQCPGYHNVSFTPWRHRPCRMTVRQVPGIRVSAILASHPSFSAVRNVDEPHAGSDSSRSGEDDARRIPDCAACPGWPASAADRHGLATASSTGHCCTHELNHPPWVNHRAGGTEIVRVTEEV